MAENLLIGAHTSAAGGVHNALLNGQKIGATTVQLFTSNQKQWASKPIADDEVVRWKNAMKETGLQKIMSHDSYLINLGSPDNAAIEKSRKAFIEETKRCLQLDISYLNFHPGAALCEDEQNCLDRIADSLLLTEGLVSNSSLMLILELTAGQGSSVGYRFEHIAYILQKVKDKIPLGVCIDTCHIFAAGYDIRTKEGWDKVLLEFDRIIGLKYLKAFHLNDSAKKLGTRVDRHADLGKGEIGIESFKILMNDKRTRHLPKYLETPGGPERWIEEIALLRELSK